MSSNVKLFFALSVGLIGILNVKASEHAGNTQLESTIMEVFEDKINKMFKDKINHWVDGTLNEMLESKISTILESKLETIEARLLQGLNSPDENNIPSQPTANLQGSGIDASFYNLFNLAIEKKIYARIQDAVDRSVDELRTELLGSKTDIQADKSTPVSNLPQNNGLKTSQRFVLGPDQYPGVIGFTACISPPDLTNLGSHHVIVFDKSITNVGNAYHNHTGIFIAPLKGLFVFHLTSMMVPHATQYLQFVKDGQIINHIYPDADQSGDYGISGNLWVMSLEQGSEVWIQMKGPGQIHGNCFTVFSGFLLYELE